MIGQIFGAMILGGIGLEHIPKTENLQPTLIPWPSNTATPTITSTVTNTPRPTRTPTSTSTPRPTWTKRPTATPTPTNTPNRGVFLYPSPDNFEEIAGKIARAVNTANVLQVGKPDIDPSDLEENYMDFNRNKYLAAENGERLYKYLHFNEYRRMDYNDEKVYIKARVIVPEVDEYFTSEGRYLNEILYYLHQEEVDTSNITPEQVFFLKRDISENSQRFTCVKFMRFIWALFGDFDGTGNGIIPELYQLRIQNAGELAFQIIGGGGKSIFAPENMYIVRQSLIRNGVSVSDNPENHPEFYDNKIMVYFRPPYNDYESGHVGVGKLIAEYDGHKQFKRFLITHLEVDGYTGQAHYGYRVDLDKFRLKLFAKKTNGNSNTRRVIGWLFNRQ